MALLLLAVGAIHKLCNQNKGWGGKGEGGKPNGDTIRQRGGGGYGTR